MSAKVTRLTLEGINKLEAELETLKGPKRREMAERIKIARSFGDLSENSEYDDAKNEQGQMEARIAELEAILRNVEIVSDEDISVDSVSIGSKVKLYDMEFEEEVSYQIVSSSEADPRLGRMSNEAPIGNAIMGKSVGDVVEVKAPAGTIKFKILEISK